MRTVDESLAEQRDYFLRWGRPHEADHSFNDSNRDLIQALAAAHGGCAYLGTINGNRNLVRYEGQTIYNAEYTFCIPAEDTRLMELIQAWRSGGVDLNLLDRIHARIGALGGHLLIWV